MEEFRSYLPEPLTSLKADMPLPMEIVADDMMRVDAGLFHRIVHDRTVVFSDEACSHGDFVGGRSVPLPSEQIARYATSLEGKRLRPMLTLLVHRLRNPDSSASDHTLLLAGCVELIHAASLLHDDVIDGSTTRRGHPCVHTVHGISAAILTGDFILSRVYQAIFDSQDFVALKHISETLVLLASGELRSFLMLQQGKWPSWETYRQAIYAKTACVFELAAFLGVCGAWGTSSDSQAVCSFARHLGMAFQYVDDICDYWSAPPGKTPYRDLAAGLVTLPVFASMEQACPNTQRFWLDVLTRKGEPSSSVVAKVHDVLTNTGAWVRAVDRIDDQLQKARRHLSGLERVSPEVLRAMESLTWACRSQLPRSLLEEVSDSASSSSPVG